MTKEALLSTTNQFLGCSEGWKETFMYNIVNMGEDGITISVPSQDFKPAVGNKLNICLPFKLNSEFFDQCWITKVDLTPTGTICFGRLTHRTPLRYPLYFDVIRGETAVEDKQAIVKEKLLELLNDAKLTKKTILIYLQHLIPFFSRVSRLCPTEHTNIEENIESVKNHIKVNIANIEALETETLLIENPLTPNSQIISRYLQVLLPEVSEKALTNLYSISLMPEYIKSIKLLEHKLCLNYNTVILLQYWKMSHS